ncbi:MAG: branched-chain amino acid ABC transporter permease [Desulfomonile tiedjei]|uniref:Branched-chain amino acid ABC transporter permease n=1 Tax=Desulfomonile tiedjei TaxID=2358 RepID=A0A9D6Z2T5_9BACT|nr:branched-chain amino acid ABC transporter permease [Desulfomonile tiedjei]
MVTRDRILTCLAAAGFLVFLWYADSNFSEYSIRILNNIAIFIVVAVSYNLINGITGQFSLQPNAFLAVGAYTAAILTLTPEEKLRSFILEPLIWPLSDISLSFPVSLLAAGVVTALVAFLLAVPVFRVRGDYLAIVTLGFGEVLQVIANNLVPVTNGPLGLKGLTPYTNLWWSWGICILTIFCTVRLVNSSYGRAMKAIREDETAAQAMGIDAFRTKTLAFVFSAFFEGIAGGLLAHLITTISPSLFTFMLTFNLLIMIVIGGLGSTTGAVIGAALITWGGEVLRFVEEPISLFGYYYEGIPGMRMVIFSALLIFVMLFARSGIMGRNEFSWQSLIDLVNKVVGRLRGGA